MTQGFPKKASTNLVLEGGSGEGPKVLQFGFHLVMCVARSGDGRVVTWGDAESGGAAGLSWDTSY